MAVSLLRKLKSAFKGEAEAPPAHGREYQPVQGKAVTCGLSPTQHLESVGEAGVDWVATDSDPHFLLLAPGGSRLELAAGWYRISLNLAIDRRQQVARVYFDSGEGFSEEGALDILVADGELSQRLVFLPSGAVQVRFDPQEWPGRLSVNQVAVNPVKGPDAVSECLQRILHFTSVYGEDVEAVRSAVEKRATEHGIPLEQSLFELDRDLDRDSREQTDGGPAYEDWIRYVEQPSLPDTAQVGGMLAELPSTPRVSVIVPVYNTPEDLLRRCLDSVLCQSYPHWELCIADDASTAGHIRPVLRDYIDRDHRVRVVYRPQNGHISEASNSALSIATGEFVALLDHDDELAEHALLFMVQAILAKPGVAIAYSDEDKISDDGVRYGPHFKCEWNPDLLYSQNYVSHLGVYQRTLLDRIGGFKTGVEGSQDHDLLLRCLHHVSAGQIVHVPRVLYHWRAAEGSTARGASEKDYTTDAGIKALRDYFQDMGPRGVRVTEGRVPNSYRVQWPIPEPAPLVSLLIPTRDRKDLVEVAVRSILEKTTYQNYEIIILDNGSVEPETLAFFDQVQREDVRVKVVSYDHPFNYSAINNYGVGRARGSIVGLVNNDIEVISPDWLGEMVAQASREDIGCVGAKLYYGNESIQHAGVILGLGGVAGHSHKYFDRNHPGYFNRLQLVQNLSAVTAACLLVRKDVYNAVGGLDEVNLQVAFNDVDFCLRVRAAGYRNLWTPYAELYHHESLSRGKEDSPEKIRRFQQEIRYMQEQWGELLRADPCYSPNLTLNREDFSIGGQ
ncbi:glycosyltransferase [Marinobacter bryozoorum]|uniref:glycosyltransferase family 2 protein n=1 Tax=Marinobacter bryozoorum TaxID=256324 RepID=UPI002005A527|nr:glycosyltransferase [Marinobacter bryozoorum]MCK7544807.1 glycosyltransferase [Marinobacter bryozoorum]